jgi:hypothetical protein
MRSHPNPEAAVVAGAQYTIQQPQSEDTTTQPIGTEPETSGIFEGKGMLIIGGLALAAIAVIAVPSGGK